MILATNRKPYQFLSNEYAFIENDTNDNVYRYFIV